MGKTKISRKHDFSFENMPEIKVKKSVRFTKASARKTFLNTGLIYEALMQSLTDGDAEAFREILSAFLEVTNKAKFAAKANISKRTLFRMISSNGNPTLETVARVVHALSKAA